MKNSLHLQDILNSNRFLNQANLGYVDTEFVGHNILAQAKYQHHQRHGSIFRPRKSITNNELFSFVENRAPTRPTLKYIKQRSPPYSPQPPTSI